MVSLVPSITEALATDRREALVGATDWCTRPADLDVPRVRGTKNPDLRAIRALEPDLVVANKEENRELDVRRLRDAGVQVWVTEIETVPQALDSLDRLYAVGARLATRRTGWSGLERSGTVRCPMCTAESQQRSGGTRGWSSAPARTPETCCDDWAGRTRSPAAITATRRWTLADVDRDDIDLVLLPDEPYEFTADDGPEAFARTSTRLVSGRLLTWYGPAMIEAFDTLCRG